MKKLLFIILSALFISDLSAQVNKFGMPLVRNYLPETTQGSEQTWCITKDKLGNMYFGTQDRGVVRYNGKTWISIPVRNNPRIYSVAADDRGIVYVGAAYEFGYLQPDLKGSPEYISLSGRIDSIPEIKNVWSIGLKNNKVYFQCPWYIYVYNTETDSLSKINLRKYNLKDSYRLYKINNTLVLADNIAGLFELNDTTLTQLPGGSFFKRKPCTVLLPFDENRMIVSTFRDGLFIYNYKTGEITDNFVDSKLNDKFKELWIWSATIVNDDLFAIGVTSQEGIFIFNHKGELVQQIKKDYIDLEDDAIYAMYCDPLNGSELWVTTLGAISKIYINTPITQFGEKQGIGVGLNDVCEFQGNIYLSTDAGIYKNYLDGNNIMKFRVINGTSAQYFPLEVFRTKSGGFILACSLDGLIQISKDDKVTEVEKICRDKPARMEVINAKKILQSSADPDILFLGLESGGIDILRYDGDHWHYIDRIKARSGGVNGLAQMNDGSLWFSTDDPTSLSRITFSGKDTVIIKYGPDKGLPDTDISAIRSYGNDLFVCTSHGILKYDNSSDKLVSGNDITNGFSDGINAQNLFFDSDGNAWFTGVDKKYFEMYFKKNGSGILGFKSGLALLPNVPALDYLEKDGMIYMTKSKQLVVVNKQELKPDSSDVRTLFTNIRVGRDSVIINGTFHSDINDKRRIPEFRNDSDLIPQFSFNLNNITFEWATPYYIDEQLTKYSYKLEGFDKEWSTWERTFLKDYTNLSFGHYTFRVKAKSSMDTEMSEASYSFIILKPWYLRAWMIIIYIFSTVLLIWGIIAAYTRRLKNENIRLEGIVRERTAVVVKQKEELESSIHYARRIQMALLPSESILSDNIRNYFILFRPRDIVSGDFYWMTKKSDRLYIVAADCTGHGVPGAFMSLLGMSFLDEIIDKKAAPSSDFILNELRLHVTESLKQSGGEDEAKDGMDLGLLVIDFKREIVEYSGAYNPCYKVRKLREGEELKTEQDSDEKAEGTMTNGKYILEQINANKMPIGISSRMNENFRLNEWPLEKGVTYYLNSDGYIDQFGGAHGRKFMKKNYKRLILDLQDYTMEQQRDMFEKNLLEWRGPTPQIDDILVMGIRID